MPGTELGTGDPAGKSQSRPGQKSQVHGLGLGGSHQLVEESGPGRRHSVSEQPKV